MASKGHKKSKEFDINVVSWVGNIVSGKNGECEVETGV
jgi:hypothetical protein